jgi:hypothetical protein
MEDELARSRFFHDLANNFSVIDFSLSRVLKKLCEHHPDLVDEIQRLQKAHDYSKKSIDLLKTFRAEWEKNLENKG